MTENSELLESYAQELTLNLAIVGGGKSCKALLELFQKDLLPDLTINIVGVCDTNPEAEGLKMAKGLGIYTSDNYTDLFSIDNLNGLIELTSSKDALLEVIRQRPKGLWVIDHNTAQLIMRLFRLNETLKAKEQEVALERMVSEFLLQHGNERIVLLSPDFTILEASEAYLEAVNSTKEKTVGKHCYEITHGFSSPCSEWEPEMGCPLMETLKTGKSAHAIHEHIVEGVHTSYCDLETYPVKNALGEVVRVIEIWRDITDDLSPRWENRLKEVKSDLGKLVKEDRMISLGQLAASCVHEINNPIQGLLTFSNLMQSILAEGDPSQRDLEQFKEYLDLMSGELERCGNIVSGLLSFARESTMETRDVEINEVIESVITLTRNRMELQDINLKIELSKQPLVLRGDVNELQQCFLNLIFNAIDAMPDGGDLLVTSGLDEKKRIAQVVFRDSGCGIPEKYINHIFDPFFTTKEENGGTGLGLSIVYGIVRGCDGAIDVKSIEGEGSTFTLTFPMSKIAEIEE